MSLTVPQAIYTGATIDNMYALDRLEERLALLEQRIQCESVVNEWRYWAVVFVLTLISVQVYFK
jgi:hypothetical protein